MAGAFARAVGAKNLVISHFSARYTELHPKIAAEKREFLEST